MKGIGMKKGRRLDGGALIVMRRARAGAT